MKKNSITGKGIGVMLIFFLALSCQKNQEQPQQSLPSTSSSSIQLKTIIDTIHIEDSLWSREIHYYGAGGATWSVEGDYYSDLNQFVGARQVMEVLVYINGKAIEVGADYSLAYQNGFFKSTSSKLYFSGTFGQLSFRSVEIDIVTKD